MPYVTVVFDPKKIPQKVVNQLKVRLQPFVAGVLSSDAVRLHPAGLDDITTPSADVIVMQKATHPTDVNVPPMEIYIEAGRPRGRSGHKIAELLGQAIAELDLIPQEYLGEGQSAIFVIFHEHTGFGFIPKSN